MKKLLLVLAIGAFVACNNSGTTENKVDSASSTTTTVDSPAVVTPDTSGHAGDTTKTADTTRK